MLVILTNDAGQTHEVWIADPRNEDDACRQALRGLRPEEGWTVTSVL